MAFSFGFAADDDDDAEQRHNNLPATSAVVVQGGQTQLPQELSLQQLVGMQSPIIRFIPAGLDRVLTCLAAHHTP